MHIPLEVAVGIPTSLCIEKEVSHPDPNPFHPATACAFKIEFPQGFLMAAVFIALWN